MHNDSLRNLGLVPDPTLHSHGRKTMVDETRLAEMLCTRLCHDLTGPIGAVNNGAEFLSEEGFDMQNEAMQLVLSSAHEAVNRLQFYRQAYGRVSEGGEASIAEKKQLAVDFFSATKVKLDWPDSHTDASGISISQKMARLILNLLIVTGTSLIRGGTLSVRLSETDDGYKHVAFTAEGQTIKLDDEAKAILLGDTTAPLTPKLAQLYLTLHILREIDASLAIDIQEGSLNITVSQRAIVSAPALM